MHRGLRHPISKLPLRDVRITRCFSAKASHHVRRITATSSCVFSLRTSTALCRLITTAHAPHLLGRSRSRLLEQLLSSHVGSCNWSIYGSTLEILDQPSSTSKIESSSPAWRPRRDPQLAVRFSSYHFVPGLWFHHRDEPLTLRQWRPSALG